MKVLSLRADYSGCAFYRITEPARVVSEQFGVDIRVDIDLAVDATKNTVTKDYVVREVQEDIDLLIIQRPLNKSLYQVVKQAQRQGIAVIVELDDDFANVLPGNSAWKKINPALSPHSNYEWLQKTAIMADSLIVSTPALQSYGHWERTHVLRNCVPESIFSVRPHPGTKRGIGWTGTVQTHPGDLQETRGGVAEASLTSGLGVRVVGDGYGVSDALGFPNSWSVEATGWVDLSDYYQTIVNNISVGIVPLANNAFNEAKSSLKGLEMAALGIPFIASPTAEYSRLANMGIGQIAHDRLEWFKKTRALAEKPIKRSSTGKKYQNIVRDTMTYEQNAINWLQAWEQTISYSKSQLNVLR